MNPVHIVSFGFLHDSPPQADAVLDLRRLLSDPAHKPQGDMLDMTGLDEEVRQFVFDTPGATVLACNTAVMTRCLADVKPVTLAFGCAGGRHRSVALAEAAAGQLRLMGVEVTVEHLHIHLPRVIRA